MKYVKKPVVIDAILLEPTEESIRKFIELKGEVVNTTCNASRFAFEHYCDVVIERGFVEIHTLEGVMKASFGDYIIKGVKGELYPCKPDIFNETYERHY